MAGLADFPPTGQFLRSVRETCRALRIEANITISEDNIKRLLLSPSFTTSFSRLRNAHGLTFPLKFPSVLSEVNFIAVLALLNFGSGWRVPLHRATGNGAYDTIRLFMFSVFLSADGNVLSARWMQTITESEVAEFMRVSIHVEKPHDRIPGVVVGEIGGPIYEFVQLVTQTLNETGRHLLASGYTDLGSFVLESLKEATRTRESGEAAEFVLEQLVRAIPGFRDMAKIDGQNVYIFKKALFLLHALKLRFSSSVPPSIPLVETAHLPAFSDNVLPSMLVHLGIIGLGNAPGSLPRAFPDLSLESLYAEGLNPVETSKAMPEDGPHLSPEEAYILRAAAVDACETIVHLSRISSQIKDASISSMTPPELDGWLWSVAKERQDYRTLKRFVQTGTPFF